MVKLWTLTMMTALVACETRYYVADVHHAGGAIVVTKCELGYRGVATHYCHDETLDNSTATASARSRPPPSDDTLASAFRAKGVTELVVLCRNAYAADVTSLAVGITVQPSGTITNIEPHGVAGKFADCTSHALRAANIEPYDGAPVHSELQLAL